MAWGGARAGAGRPKKPLADKLIEGRPVKRGRKTPRSVNFSKNQVCEKKERIQDAPGFLLQNGLEAGDSVPSAAEIYALLAAFVKSSGCEKLVSPTLIEDFSHLRRSFLECEFINRTRGRVANGKRSPYVTMAVDYNKQALSIYDRVWNIVAQNSEQPYNDGKNEFLNLLANRGF